MGGVGLNASKFKGFSRNFSCGHAAPGDRGWGNSWKENSLTSFLALQLLYQHSRFPKQLLQKPSVTSGQCQSFINPVKSQSSPFARRSSLLPCSGGMAYLGGGNTDKNQNHQSLCKNSEGKSLGTSGVITLSTAHGGWQYDHSSTRLKGISNTQSMEKSQHLIKVLRRVTWSVLFSCHFFKLHHKISQGRRKIKKTKWWHSTGNPRNNSVQGTAGVFSMGKISAKQNCVKS